MTALRIRGETVDEIAA
ncbi:MAG: hypothetical protein ACK41P_02165, partial [Asticcacaulis sp.]